MSEELKALKKQLLKDDRNGYDVLSAADLEKMEAYCTVYKAFLDAGKTERLSARAAIALAEKHGFVEYKRGMSLSAGDKVYSCNRGKGLVLAVVGRRSLAEGAQITAAHIDSPRLDLKPTPLYEDSELAYFKTHYYGGVRKYQWVTIPLELRGTVVLRDGSVVDVCIGEGDEPKLVITDLLPHLGAEQSKKPLGEAIPGETLNILLGSRPLGDDDDSDRVKMQVLKRLYDKYWRRCLPSTPPISAWTAASSAPTATMTASAASLLCRPFWTSGRRKRPPSAFWPTRRRSAPWASPACSPPPSTPL